MKSLGDFRDLALPLAEGMLDSRSASGEGARTDFRLLLNVGTDEARGRSRLPGWTAWGTFTPSNEDLHDQLLGGAGTIVADAFVATAGQREAITLLSEVRATTGVIYTIAATKSRIYVSTGQGGNWKIIADGLSGGFTSGESPWSSVQFTMAQAGDFALFTNGVDPVLAWPIGGQTIATGPDADRRWAAFEIFDLLGVGTSRAGCIAYWNGFAFVADLVMDGTRYPGRIQWSDAGAPLEWAPGGESLAGYFDFGGGEVVLKIATIGGQLRVYTDKAIYAVTLIGGDAVFNFQEIYRGDLAVAIKNSFVNLGEVHMWMVQDSLVWLGAYDRVPNRYEWAHRASGFIFKGLDGRYLTSLPLEFDGFNPLDKTRCHQVATGYDANLGNVWISWPTQRTSDETPDDPDDFDGVRRLTMILNPRYQKATLVDHGFSAFTLARKHQWQSVRDFMVQHGVCSPEELLSDEALLGEKEGFPLTTSDPPEDTPTCIWNETEDPTLPMSETSVAAQVCDVHLSIDCNQCVAAPAFAMASTADLCIKEFDLDSRVREVYATAPEAAVPVVGSYSAAPHGPGSFVLAVTPGQSYHWVQGATPGTGGSFSPFLVNGVNTYTEDTTFVAEGATITFWGTPGDPVIDTLFQVGGTYIPVNSPTFPNVVLASYTQGGYPFLIQGELTQWGSDAEKILRGVKVSYDAETQTTPGRLLCQLGVSNSQHCTDWHDAEDQALDCLRGDADGSTSRAIRPAQFHFFNAGAWFAYRLFLATESTEDVFDYAPVGCGVTFNKVTIRAKPKNETWNL